MDKSGLLMHSKVFVSFLVDNILDDIIILSQETRIEDYYFASPCFLQFFRGRSFTALFSMSSSVRALPGTRLKLHWSLNCSKLRWNLVWSCLVESCAWTPRFVFWFWGSRLMHKPTWVFFYRATKFFRFDIFCLIFFVPFYLHNFRWCERCSCVCFGIIVFLCFSRRCNYCGPFLFWRCLRMHLSRPLPLIQKTTKHGTGR